jgi:hypothetical protein
LTDKAKCGDGRKVKKNSNICTNKIKLKNMNKLYFQKMFVLCLLFCAVERSYSQSWSPVCNASGIGYINTLEVDSSSNKLYMAGYFNSRCGVTAKNVIAYDGISWDSLSDGLNSEIRVLKMVNGDLYAGGIFTQSGTTSISKIAKWNGSSWSALGSGLSNSVSTSYCFASAITEYAGELYVGGYFNIAGGVNASGIAKWNGTSWSAVGLGISASSSVLAMEVYNGELYVGGSFTTAGGIAAQNIAKWNGTSWSAVGSGMTAQVRSLKVFNGELYAGGNFGSTGVGPYFGIARWNGNVWNNVGPGVNGHVSSILVFNQKLYLGGSFIPPGAISSQNVASWDGISWDTLGVGLHDISLNTTTLVRSLTVYNNSLYAGGVFVANSVNGQLYLIAKWDFTTSIEEKINPDNIHIFPNPADDLVTLTSTNAFNSASLYNLLGEEVYSTNATTRAIKQEIIDVSNLPVGIYTLRIQTNNFIENRKIVIK